MRSMPVWLMVLSGGIFSAATPATVGAEPCHSAELFAADSPDPLFELHAGAAIALNGASLTGSTPLDGVFWSPQLQRITVERSREFHLCADEGSLHTAAEVLRREFDQEAVLTFDYLPQDAPAANAVLIDVPVVDVARFRDVLAADPAAGRRLRGGSVTITDHTLILVAGNDDRDVARRVVGEAGGNWDIADIAYGRSEFAE